MIRDEEMYSGASLPSVALPLQWQRHSTTNDRPHRSEDATEL